MPLDVSYDVIYFKYTCHGIDTEQRSSHQVLGIQSEREVARPGRRHVFTSVPISQSTWMRTNLYGDVGKQGDCALVDAIIYESLWNMDV